MYFEESTKRDNYNYGLLTLHYGKHHATIIDEIQNCLNSEHFTDMCFICDDNEPISAHRLIIATASPLIRTILNEISYCDTTAVIHIPGVKSVHLRYLLDYLYNGQVLVQVCHIFLKLF